MRALVRTDIGNKVQIVGSPEKSEALNDHTTEGVAAEKEQQTGPEKSRNGV